MKMSLLLNIFNENFAKFMASQNVLLHSVPRFLGKQVNCEKLLEEGATEQLPTQNLP